MAIAKHATLVTINPDNPSKEVSKNVWNADHTVTLGADENFVTDAQLTNIGTIPDLAPKASPVFTGTLTVPVGLTGVLRADVGVMSVDAMTAYPLLAGRATPQTLAFGNAASAATGYLTSTSHATKGKYFLNAAGTITVDELNTRFGVGTATPGTTLDINGIIRSNNYFWASGTNGNAYFGVDGPTGYKSIYVEASSNPKIQIGTSVANGIKIVNSSLILNTGTATAGTAPLKFTTGVNTTVAVAGQMEYDNTFHLTNSDATRRHITLAASATKTTAGAPYTNDGYITLNIGGTDVRVMTTA